MAKRHTIRTIRLSNDVYDNMQRNLHSIKLEIVRLGTAEQIKRGSFGCKWRTAKALENKIVAVLCMQDKCRGWRDYILPNTPIQSDNGLWRYAIIKNDGTITNWTIKNGTSAIAERLRCLYEYSCFVHYHQTIKFCTACGSAPRREDGKCPNGSMARRTPMLCSRCGEVIRTKIERERCLCKKCRSNYVNYRFGYHDWREAPRFSLPKRRETFLHMGYELEMHSRLEDDSESTYDSGTTGWLTKEIGMIINTDVFEPAWHFETDGSLKNHGIECISEPLTLQKHYFSMPKVKEALDFATNNGAYINSGCGLHVHIDRRFFGTHSQFASLKLAYMMTNFRNYLDKISGRTATSYCEPIEIEKNEDVINSYNKLSISTHHHTAINICNANTIEIRIFKSTFNVDILMMYLDLVNAFAKIAKEKSYDYIGRMKFEAVAKWITYRETIDAIKSRFDESDAKVVKKLYKTYETYHKNATVNTKPKVIEEKDDVVEDEQERDNQRMQEIMRFARGVRVDAQPTISVEVPTFTYTQEEIEDMRNRIMMDYTDLTAEQEIVF